MKKIHVTRDGSLRGIFDTETEAWQYLHRILPYSIDHAVKWEGWKIEEVEVPTDEDSEEPAPK